MLPAALNPDRTTAQDGRTRLPYLDGWRGLAVLSVWVGHFTPVPGLDFGDFGVQLFFVLSGRLMAQILFVDEFPLRAFYIRRISRVYPAMLVFATCAFVVFQFADYNRIPIANYLAALTFTSNYMFLIQPADVLNHLWSLAVEEHTYVILGALAFAARRHGWAPMPVLMALAAVCLLNGAVQTAILGNEDMRFVYWRTDVAMASILMGAIGWLWWTEKQRTVPGYLPMAALALALLLNLEPFPHPVKYGVAPALLAVAVVTLERAPRLMLALLCAPFLVQIGIWSFSLYLWQQPFYLMSVKLPLPLMLAGAVATSLLSFYLVEQPARRALNARFGGRRRPSVEPVPI